jgi:hypothetical protein
MQFPHRYLEMEIAKGPEAWPQSDEDAVRNHRTAFLPFVPSAMRGTETMCVSLSKVCMRFMASTCRRHRGPFGENAGQS